jgi:MFS family permease
MDTSWRRFATLLHLSGLFTPSSPPSGSASPGSPDAADPATSYLADLLRDTREELARADSKAALLLAATGVVVGALLAGLLGGRWTPFSLDTRVEWIWWLGVACAAAGIFSISAAVYPRIHRPDVLHPPPTPSYFGDVVAYKDIQMFRQAVEQAPSRQERLIDQTFTVSRIVQRKYVLLRRGLRFLLLAILACTVAVLINIPLSR